MFPVFLIDVVPFFLFFFLNPFQTLRNFPFPILHLVVAFLLKDLSPPPFHPCPLRLSQTFATFFSFGTAKLYLFISPSKSFSKFFRVSLSLYPLLNFALLPFSRKAAAKLILFSFPCKQILENIYPTPIIPELSN